VSPPGQEARNLARYEPDDLARVAGEVCGLHAQVLSSAELSLWARIDGLPRDAVREALWTHRSLVKLWAMRVDRVGGWPRCARRWATR
jgi:Winged helix DNA-binding domain